MVVITQKLSLTPNTRTELGGAFSARSVTRAAAGAITSTSALGELPPGEGTRECSLIYFPFYRRRELPIGKQALRIRI